MLQYLKRLLSTKNDRAFAVSQTNRQESASKTPIVEIPPLGYVPLPRAPIRWETAHTISTPIARDDFEVHDAKWKIASVEKLDMSERPDPAFRRFHPSRDGMFMLDDLGKSSGLEAFASAAMFRHQDGSTGAKVGLSHDIYRVGVHALGTHLGLMSRDCRFHVYDQTLKPVTSMSLCNVPEVSALCGRLGIAQDAVKNHLRCVAVSELGDRFLFTSVDEAYCYSISGNRLWSVKLPMKDGWRKVSMPNGSTNTSVEVQHALGLMRLQMPLGQQQLKARYRELAKQWHPDVNPGDTQASARMQALTNAMTTLTGIDTSQIPKFVEEYFRKEILTVTLDLGDQVVSATFCLGGNELSAADWIYAAGFAGGSNAVYLAGYSGKVFVLDEDGRGIRLFDIGAVPTQIVDTGRFLYLLTDTRLYVLRDDELHALVDVMGAGRLMMAKASFGFTQEKSVRWYGETGQYLGTIATKDPIRQIYQRGADTIIETRQRRAVIQGMPSWW